MSAPRLAVVAREVEGEVVEVHVMPYGAFGDHDGHKRSSMCWCMPDLINEENDPQIPVWSHLETN